MTANPPPQQNSNQHISAGPNSHLIANNGNGRQKVRSVNRNVFNLRGVRSFAGWALLTCVLADVIYPIYGAAAYTGRPDDDGDMWRAGIYLVLLITTGTLLRRWLRRRL
jgi:hypothetical protein